MSEPPSSSDKQPQSPQPRIDQDSCGDFLGGQQAAIGNHNYQYQDNSKNDIYNFYTADPYLGLQDEDLEPLGLQGKVLSYLGVFIFLVLTLIFWFFFGLFINFPFPFRQVIDLIYSCFRGKVGSKVNALQKQLQAEDIESQSLGKLNKIDFQARLYLRTLEYLRVDKAKSHERLAKTMEALRQKRSRLQDEIKPRQPIKYRTVTKVQDLFESFTLNQTEKDLVQIETILREVSLSVRDGYPSEKIVQDTINKLSKEISQRANKINPSGLGLLYRIEALLHEVSAKSISNLEESELNDLNKKIIDDLKERRDFLTRKVNELLIEKRLTQQALESYSDQLLKLSEIADDRESEVLKLQERIACYAEEGNRQKITINALKSEVNKLQEELKYLQYEKNDLNTKINQLNQSLRLKQADIEKLGNQVSQYSGMRILEGKYIGNLSDLKTKYHFDRTCPSWKMLVADYVLCIDPLRKIVSSSDPTFFTDRLEECDKCARQSS